MIEESSVSVSVLMREPFVGSVSPGVDGAENNDARGHVANKRELSPHLGHHELCVEDITEDLLLVGRGKVLDLAANARRNLRRHGCPKCWWRAGRREEMREAFDKPPDWSSAAPDGYPWGR